MAIFSDSDDESNPNASLPDHITMPSREMRPIIDKMAVYVVRNGADFELMMRKKNDERFRFLNTWHPHHSYYEYKREHLKRQMNDFGVANLDPNSAKSRFQDRGVQCLQCLVHVRKTSVWVHQIFCYVQ